jgi:asparagine synthase (glutamine-hydrolysing)
VPMNKTDISVETRPNAKEQSGSRWFVRLSDGPAIDVSGFDCHLLAGTGRAPKLCLGAETGGGAPSWAESSNYTIIFGGSLFNGNELQKSLGEPAAVRRNDAEIILAAFQRWGEDCLRRLRGTFALVIWDVAREVLLCLRDPLGTYPLFYAHAGKDFVVSPVIDVLLKQPGVSPRVNRVMMAGYLAQRFEKMDETFFEAVNRVLTGHVLCLTRSGCRTYRYWDPAPNGKVDWLTAGEVDRFDEVFERAVNRCLSLGRASIFLSGGLDSVSVAALALEQARAKGMPQPWALSLAFPHPESDEEAVQRSVAEQLGLPQVVKPFFEATGENGLLGPALALSSSLPAPLLGVWLPAYYQLAREGKSRGCDVILTGNGGDEWLTVGPYIAADLLGKLDFLGFYRLWQSHRRSYRLSGFALLRNLLWRFGAAPILVPPVHRFVKQVAPWAIRLRHRVSQPEWVPAKWVAPDPELRRELFHRMEEADQKRGNRRRSFYDQAGRLSLGHSLMSWELEELFDVYGRANMRVIHPFWDADLVDLLYRTPPFMLNSGGRTKGLVRDSVARRFPRLGFERQQKVIAAKFHQSLVAQDAHRLWQESGGVSVLANLGVVDEDALPPNWAQPKNPREAFRVWSLLNLEAWARTHVS